MFRGNASHQNTLVTKDKRIFGELGWQFDAGAPIRSTAVCGGSSIYFGTAKGVFYALDKTNGQVNWEFNTGHAIHSSPAYNNDKVYFADNQQTLYCLHANTGKTIWKTALGANLKYAWNFDYYYSSPTIAGNNLLIGGKDGFVYNFDASTGKLNWKHQVSGIVRSSPAVENGVLYVGNTDGILYALSMADGKEIWQFKTMGNGLKNEEFGFDRRAIISSPMIADGKIIFGCRDGILYAINISDGKEAWRMDHQVSWVISSVSVKDSMVVTGTSDGRFVQAVSLHTGKQIWKYRTVSIVWSSPIICNNTIYIGSQEGVLYAFDLYTGKKLNSFQASGKIFSSPIIEDGLLYFGTDNGRMYALKPATHLYPSKTGLTKMVYWENGFNSFLKYGTDIKLKEYLNENGYQTIGSEKLAYWLANKDSAVNSVVVMASSYFPDAVINANEKSLLRSYLNNGGKLVMTGINPLVYILDSTTKSPIGFNIPKSDSVLGINYGPNDTRGFGGLQPASPTSDGEAWGLRKSWTSFLPLPTDKVDIVLGKNEEGNASAWVKRYNPAKGSGLVQIWVDEDGVDDISFVMKVAEYGLGE